MRTALLLCLYFLSVSLFAQDDILTEGDIKQQTRFIEAKREALLGKTEKAISMFKELVEATPAMDAAQFELGRLQYAAGNTEDAIDHLKKAYGKRPNEVYASFLAELYQASGRHKEGAELYEGLIKKNPEEADYYLERAAFLVRAQDVKGAIGTYNQLENLIGVNIELARLKHSLYLGQGDQKRAEKELSALVASQPENLRFRHMLAGYFTSQKETGKAKKVYEKILLLQPADVRAQLALQDVGPTKSSGSDAELMALLGRSDIHIDLKVGKLLPLVNEVAQTQDEEKGTRAVMLTTELRRVHPDEAKAAALQGDVFFHTGRLAEAADAYRATIELDDTVYSVWEQLLATLYLDNQTIKLRKYAEEALDVFPNRPVVYVHYALGEALRSNFSEANSLLEQAQLMTSGQPKGKAAIEQLSLALSGLEAGGATVKTDLAQLPGGKEGPLAFLITNGSNASSLIAYDTEENTNALFLEMLGDAYAKSGDKAAAAKAYARSKATGSKSTNLRGKMTRVQ
ncbi:MAG: tetratricopeptide repeat protein [Lewinella sp.]|nr:tetratricopeptide repeat protein [Lewinella sp.]